MDIKDKLLKIISNRTAVSEDQQTAVSNLIEKINHLEITDNTVAIIESFTYHAVIQPSIIKYFLELGYNVHLYNLPSHQKSNALIRCDFNKNNFNVFTFPYFPNEQNFYDLFLNYKVIFVCTLFTHNGYNFANNMNTNYQLRYNKNNVYFIDHDLISVQKNINTIEQGLLDNNKIFVLRNNILYKNRILPFVSPIDFGNIKSTQKHSDIVNFISIGGGFTKNVHNFTALFDYIDKLIANNIKNFHISFIGVTKEHLEPYLTDDNQKYISVFGYVSFEKLYTEIEQADFILFNIDRNSNVYEKYSKYGISGSYLLSLGFRKPALVYEELSYIYNIENCCLPYNEKTFYDALVHAINMDIEDYQILQENLEALKENLQRISIENLKTVIKEINNG